MTEAKGKLYNIRQLFKKAKNEKKKLLFRCYTYRQKKIREKKFQYINILPKYIFNVKIKIEKKNRYFSLRAKNCLPILFGHYESKKFCF